MKPLENNMVQGDYYREEKPRIEAEYDPDTDPNYEEDKARRLANQMADGITGMLFGPAQTDTERSQHEHTETDDV